MGRLSQVTCFFQINFALKSKLTVDWIEYFIWERQHENSCKDLVIFLMQLGYVDGGRMGWFHTGAEKTVLDLSGPCSMPDLPLNNVW